jgi:hypothetical protein
MPLKPKRVFSAEARARMSASHVGKRLSEAHRLALGRAHRGIVHTPECRKRISETMTGRKYSPERRTASGKGHTQYPGITQRDRNLRKNYGITELQYVKLLYKQHGVCAICGKEERRVVRGTLSWLTVDHNHVTGKVRGLLCSQCNWCLGAYEAVKDKYEKYLKEAA